MTPLNLAPSQAPSRTRGHDRSVRSPQSPTLIRDMQIFLHIALDTDRYVQ
jgi:hypothetical protein